MEQVANKVQYIGPLSILHTKIDGLINDLETGK